MRRRICLCVVFAFVMGVVTRNFASTFADKRTFLKFELSKKQLLTISGVGVQSKCEIKIKQTLRPPRTWLDIATHAAVLVTPLLVGASQARKFHADCNRPSFGNEGYAFLTLAALGCYAGCRWYAWRQAREELGLRNAVNTLGAAVVLKESGVSGPYPASYNAIAGLVEAYTDHDVFKTYCTKSLGDDELDLESLSGSKLNRNLLMQKSRLRLSRVTGHSSNDYEFDAGLFGFFGSVVLACGFWSYQLGRGR